MTDFIQLHTFPLDIANGSWKESFDEIGGSRTRSPSGAMHQTRVTEKRMWKGSTTYLDPNTAAAIETIMLGKGLVASFDADTFFSLGIGPNAGGGGGLQSTFKKFGANALQIASGAANQVYQTPFVNQDVTVLFWERSSTDSTSFVHWAITITSTGTIAWFMSGAPTTTRTFATIANTGILTLKARNNADAANLTVQYDDLMVLPCILTNDMIAAFAGATIAWADMPKVNVSGLGYRETAPIQVFAKPDDVEYAQGVSPVVGVGFIPNLQKINFTFWEA